MTGAWRQGRVGRRGFIALAALALMIQVLIPQGFMVSDSPGGPSLVICTGHGALLLSPAQVQGDHGLPGKAPKSTHDMACGFAGHGGAAAAPSMIAAAAAAFAQAAAAPSRRFDIAPGRGLAAPPPPSQAPPTRLI